MDDDMKYRYLVARNAELGIAPPKLIQQDRTKSTDAQTPSTSISPSPTSLPAQYPSRKTQTAATASTQPPAPSDDDEYSQVFLDETDGDTEFCESLSTMLIDAYNDMQTPKHLHLASTVRAHIDYLDIHAYNFTKYDLNTYLAVSDSGADTCLCG